MGKREIEIGGKKLIIHEQEDVCDPNTGRALTGSWVWDSSLHLAHWIATQAGMIDFQLQGKSVLELGAGTGLPGLIAASVGAAHVVLTDIAPLLPGLRTNVDANGLADRVEVRELVWGSDEPWVCEVDLVFMSDVFYDPVEMPALGKTLKRVCGRETRVWAASEIRTHTTDCLEVLKGEGFEVVELPLSDSSWAPDDSEVAAEKLLFAVFLLSRRFDFPGNLQEED